MNIAKRYPSRFAHGLCFITSTVILFACAGQPTEPQVQSIDEIAVSAEAAKALADRQAWMRKESPEELAVLIAPDGTVRSPDGKRFFEVDECGQISQNLADVVINEMIFDVLIRAGITPIRADGREAPQKLVLAVTLYCVDAAYTYDVHFIRIHERGSTARSVSSGHIGSRAEAGPREVLESLRHEVELVVADYTAANSI